MKGILLLIASLVLTLNSVGINKTPKDYGFTHLTFNYKGDKVDILIKSKKGEENQKKPLFFYCQGSMPQPLIKYDEGGVYGVFSFKTDSLAEKYHLVIVSKPYIPLICDTKELGKNFCYIDTTGIFPKQYSDRNLLSYYVDRNISIIEYLQQQAWVSDTRLVVAGHSEGSTIAAKMASVFPAITHLIYSGGNPMGRMMSMIQEARAKETYSDTIRCGEDEIKYWEQVVKDKMNMDSSQGDTNKAAYEFSYPPIEYLEAIDIPILISYGTKDWGAPFNDFLRIDVIRKGKKNFQFNPYIGTEHNYFPLTSDNKPDYDIFNWDNVANDWLKWLNGK